MHIKKKTSSPKFEGYIVNWNGWVPKKKVFTTIDRGFVQARSQDLEKGGAILKKWEKCKRPWPEFSLSLNQCHTVSPKIKAAFLRNLGILNILFAQIQVISKKKNRSSRILRLIFWPKSEIQTFFPPKFRWFPKKKRSSPILRLIFRPTSEIRTFEGGCFPMGGLFSIFHQKSASKAPKTCDFAHFTSQWGGCSPPAPPPRLRYWFCHHYVTTVTWSLSIL